MLLRKIFLKNVSKKKKKVSPTGESSNFLRLQNFHPLRKKDCIDYLTQWFSTSLEARRRPTKDEYEHFVDPPLP